MTSLYRVLYCSRNNLAGAAEVSAAEIERILATSRRNNARDGVTGGLIFTDGCFAQVLEGPLDVVEATFERIQCDERHGEVTVLQSGSIAQREFSDWAMAYGGADTSQDRVVGTRLSSAFAARSQSGQAVLELLRSLVVREADWLVKA